MTDTNQLPEPELGYIQTDKSNQPAFSARQMREAMGLATQPADVTDEQIAACVKRASTYGLPFVGLLNPGGTPSDFSKRFTVEILALRPVQMPLTDEQWLEYLLRNANNSVLHVAAFVGESIQTRGQLALRKAANDLRKLVEQAYGIKPKEQA